jgi:hypothetical protein
MKFAYADPPYIGLAKKFYAKHHADAADYDQPETHKNLITQLCDEYPDGWLVCLQAPALAFYLSICPEDVRVGAWCKTWHQIRPTTTQFAWEPVIWRGGRKDNKRSPMIRDWMSCPAARGQGLRGSKPPEFNRWVLDLLNYREGDEIIDLFPGTEGMSKVVNQGVFV